MRRPCHAARSSASPRVHAGHGRSPQPPDPHVAAPAEKAQPSLYPVVPIEESPGTNPGRSHRSRERRGEAGGQEPEPLLTPAEILDLAKASMRSFRRWTANGELEVVRLGRSIRIRRSAWEAFLHKQSRKS